MAGKTTWVKEWEDAHGEKFRPAARRTLRDTNGNRKAAAVILGVTYNRFRYWLKQRPISAPVLFGAEKEAVS